MAITRISNALNPASGSTTGQNRSFLYDAGSADDRLLILDVEWYQGTRNITSCTYSGVAMTSLGKFTLVSGAVVERFYLANPASGSNALAFSFNSAPSGGSVAHVTVYSGVNTASPVEDYKQQYQASTTTISHNHTLSVTNSIISTYARDLDSSSDAFASTTNFTQYQQNNYGWGRNGESGALASGTQSLSITRPGSTNGRIGIASYVIKPAAGGGTNPHILRRRMLV